MSDSGRSLPEPSFFPWDTKLPSGTFISISNAKRIHMKNSGSNPFKKTIITLGVLSVFVIGLQFTSPVIENPPVKNNIELPQNVKAILKKACFDCHSNQSNTKWFDRFAPVSYMVAHDIKDGKCDRTRKNAPSALSDVPSGCPCHQH
jgi:hypothetical protein